MRGCDPKTGVISGARRTGVNNRSVSWREPQRHQGFWKTQATIVTLDTLYSCFYINIYLLDLVVAFYGGCTLPTLKPRVRPLTSEEIITFL